MTAHLEGNAADHLQREVEETAAASGLARLLRDCHPLAVEAMRGRDSPVQAVRAAAPSVAAAPPSATFAAGRPAVAPGGLLTAKELEVLAMLARNYSNKEIARALDIGATTVKWHLRNLFGKLNVGGRRHAVQRARMLQLVAPEPSLEVAGSDSPSPPGR